MPKILLRSQRRKERVCSSVVSKYSIRYAYTSHTKTVHAPPGLDDSDEPQSKVVKSHKGKSELMRESRPILEESLEEKLENMGLRKVEHIVGTNVNI